MSKKRDNIVNLAKSWLGKNEADGSFKTIIDIYNCHKPLPRSYKVKYSDEWCATTISALAIQLKYTDIIPIECSCGKMIEKAQSMGVWQEKDNYIPSPGDIILYDWNDSGKGDCIGWADHVGIVEKVSENTLFIIEGNYNKAVKRRLIRANAKFIRGYITPKYDKIEPVKGAEKIAKAQKFDISYNRVYTTTGNLHLRPAPGSVTSIAVMPKGATVVCYGYFSLYNNRAWLYVRYNGLTGFCSSKFLK